MACSFASPGGKIALELLSNSRAALQAARPTGTIAGFLGILAGKARKVATLDESDQAAGKGWAGQRPKDG